MRSSQRAVYNDSAAGLMVAITLVAFISALHPTPFSVAIAAFVAATAILLFVIRLKCDHTGSPGFNWADRVTLVRGMLTAVIAGHLALTELNTVQAHYLVVLSTAAMVLDGIDGLVARRRRLSSDFGARLDMEMDALLLLTLSALLWRSREFGIWVLAIGGMRYAFIGLQMAFPALTRPLPPSRRRKTICVVQMVALPVCLLPWIPIDGARGIAALALALLGYSFITDGRWLLRHPSGEIHEP